MNETLLNNLVCPVSNEKLEWDKENNRLINPKLNMLTRLKTAFRNYCRKPEWHYKLNKY
ncbi:Uncharacterised protein [Mannheimia haemolytica]|uniref:Trm112p-like protein n=1 Tax=Mannheimia haemolytica TaxID=75985 RepID=A0A378MYX5_MANHA|nr:Uncharacterised protein [Mannheimia haemolytica]